MFQHIQHADKSLGHERPIWPWMATTAKSRSIREQRRFSLTQDHPVSFHFSACRYLLPWLLSSLISYWVDSNFGRPPLWHLKLNVESASNITTPQFAPKAECVLLFSLPSSKRSFFFLWSRDTASAAAGRGEAQQLRLQTHMQLIYCIEACNLFSFVNSLQLEKP